MIEQILGLEELRHPASQAYFYRTHTGIEIDLVVDCGQERIGWEFKCSSSVTPSDAAGLRAGVRDGIIHKGFIVYHGQHSFPLDDTITVIPASNALK